MEHDLEELFTFAQNQMMGFEVVDNEESKSFYLNNEFIGGWAGDTREFFFENNDEFQFLKESYEARRRMEQSKKQREYAKKTKYIDIRIRQRDIEIDGKTINQLGDISTSKSLGYLDGPEDLVYDLSYNNNIQNLQQVVNAINEAKDEFMDFPKNAVFRIEGENFAELNSEGDYVINKDFSNELMQKYEGKKVLDISINKNHLNKYTTYVKFGNHDIAFIGEQFNATKPKAFDNEQEAKQAIIDYIKNDYVIDDKNIALFINKKEVDLSNKQTKKFKPR